MVLRLYIQRGRDDVRRFAMSNPTAQTGSSDWQRRIGAADRVTDAMW